MERAAPVERPAVTRLSQRHAGRWRQVCVLLLLWQHKAEKQSIKGFMSRIKQVRDGWWRVWTRIQRSAVLSINQPEAQNLPEELLGCLH